MSDGVGGRRDGGRGCRWGCGEPEGQTGLRVGARWRRNRRGSVGGGRGGSSGAEGEEGAVAAATATAGEETGMASGACKEGRRKREKEGIGSRGESSEGMKCGAGRKEREEGDVRLMFTPSAAVRIVRAGA